jgi:hypothetical protein
VATLPDELELEDELELLLELDDEFELLLDDELELLDEELATPDELELLDDDDELELPEPEPDELGLAVVPPHATKIALASIGRITLPVCIFGMLSSEYLLISRINSILYSDSNANTCFRRVYNRLSIALPASPESNCFFRSIVKASVERFPLLSHVDHQLESV